MRSEPSAALAGTASVPRRWAKVARRGARHLAGLLTAAMVTTGLVVSSPAAPAAADTVPTEPGNPPTVAADGLPTVQIDGVAYSQVVVGGTVYVAGKFSTARPAGAAPGTSTVARANLLAYNLTTGALVGTWAPKLNGPAYVITASPDGTKLYVGGDFTTVDGSAYARFVALNRSTGARVAGFASANPNGSVKSITATASTVYLGGSFNTVKGNARPRLAAVNASTGALLSWRVTADYPVEALTMSPDNSRVIVGGRFTNLSGVQARGSGAVSASTGAVQSWAANKVVTNYGWDAGITSLTTDGTLVYGTGFAHLNNAGGYGNLEGTFAADPTTGAIRWVEDCQGDTYSAYPNRGKDNIYVVGHPHFCGNIGGFSESAWRSVLSFTKAAVSTITPNKNPKYFNWAGQRAPRLLHFYPDLKVGAATASKQAAWHVTGSGDYLLLAGEFLAVNGKAQQGLVRMANSSIAPDKVGPVVGGTGMTPAATSEANGTAQVSWATSWDRDNATLTYRVLRNGGTTPVHEVRGRSHFTERPRLSFTDTGLVAGRTYSYKIAAVDPFGNTVTSSSVSVVAAGSSKGGLSAYAREVLGDHPEGYWRLGESSGVAQDWTGYADKSVGTGAGRGVAGALAGDSNKAMRFNGTTSSRVYGGKQSSGLNRVSVEAWFRTSSTKGGKIVGYGSSGTATSSGAYDRHLYVGTDGKLRFGVNPNSRRTVTAPTAVNDGRWHHAVGTLGPNGMRLYVDGVLRAESTGTIAGEISKGYWRIGGDNVSGWPSAGGQDFVGDIDDVAVYGRALSAAEVSSHRSVGTGGVATASADAATADASTADASTADASTAEAATADGATAADPAPAANTAPTASFTSTTAGLRVDVDASGSTDADGTVTGHAWTFGDGATATGPTASHTYAAPGTYTVGLTVTDDAGASTTTTREVTVTVTAATTTSATVARDAFGRTATGGWGTADLGGPWTTTSSAASVSGGTGLLTLRSAGATGSARLPGVTGTSQTTRATAQWDKRPGGSGGWWLVRGRVTTDGEYRLKLGHRATGAVTARLVRATSTGGETGLGDEVVVPGLTYAAGTGVVGELEVVGTSPTTLRARVWAAGQARPAAALLAATDSTAGLQQAGHAGLAALVSSTATNVPVTVRVDDWSVVRSG